MFLPTRASQCRRNAYYCRMLAVDAMCAADRLCLATMQRAWVALAENEDWLDGIWTGDITRSNPTWPAHGAARNDPI